MRTIIGLLGAGVLALAGGVSAEEARPPTTSPPLETTTFIKSMRVLAVHFPGEMRSSKMQMMTIGVRRYLFHSRVDIEGNDVWFVGQIIDVTDPMKPMVVREGLWTNDPYQSGQVGYRNDLKKWIFVVGDTLGRKAGAGLAVGEQGFRGVSILDVTDPANPTLLSRWSTDGGDPKRDVQQGTGTHRNYYDGGRYAYLTTGPDDSYGLPAANGRRRYGQALQILDLQDPTKPREVSTWHYPGMRAEEAEARKAWAFRDAPVSLHGPAYVPRKVEDGGRYAYGGWGAAGMLIQDVSDPAHPKLVSEWRPNEPAGYAGIPFHAIDVSRLDRGFVITNWEAMGQNCAEEPGKNYVVDVRDPAKPVLIGVLPDPAIPEGAPYKSFCERPGRYGAHNAPHLKAPGRADPNFHCLTYFVGGLQCYDVSDPRKPFVTAYFVPKQGGKPDGTPFPVGLSTRTVDDVFIEWDRRLIWVGTDSGLYLLSADALGPPVLKGLKPTAWATPGLNQGAP